MAVDDQRFAIPLNAVHETLLIDPDDVQRSEGREILNLRGDALLLRRLAREFGLRTGHLRLGLFDGELEITAVEFSFRSTLMARHSRVNSSTIVGIRRGRPSWGRACTKSYAQT